MEEPKAQIGTSCLIEESLNPRFKRISDRVSATKIELDDDHYATIFVAYTPTLGKSKSPASGENFTIS